MIDELKKIAKQVFAKYKGYLLVDKNEVSLTARNKLEGKDVECSVIAKLLDSEDYPYAVDAYERTYCIKGGRGCPCKNLNEVAEYLERFLVDYNFTFEKQISLFDC